MTEPTLTLYSDSLQSKWGFSDGDTPEHLMDYWDEVGVDYNAFDWHEVLRLLVRRHLMPAMAVNHTVEVYDIDTIHNPIRAETIDGVTIDDYQSDVQVPAKPESVTVTYGDVMAAIRAVQDRPEPSS